MLVGEEVGDGLQRIADEPISYGGSILSLAGVGVSSPIVWDDRVIVTSQTGSGASQP